MTFNRLTGTALLSALALWMLPCAADQASSLTLSTDEQHAIGVALIRVILEGGSVDLAALEAAGLGAVSRLPVSLRMT